MTDWIAAANGAWAATSSVAAILALAALLLHCGKLTHEARRLCIGVAIAGSSAACHRLYWSLWMTGTLQDAAWLSVVAATGIVAGTWIALSPYARLLLGRGWMLAAGAYIAAVALLSVWLIGG